MKSAQLITLFIGLFASFISFGQDSKTKVSKVIFKDAPRKTFHFGYVIPGGTANYEKAKEGIELMAVKWMIGGGTKELSPDQLAKKLDNLGAQIEASSDLDYTVIEMVGLKYNWQESLKIFIELLTTPGFNEKAFKNLKEDLALQAFYTQQDPETRLFQLSMANIFHGTDYHKLSEGSPTTINQLEPQEVSDYYLRLIENKKGFFTLVGDFGAEEKRQIQAMTSQITQDPNSTFPNGPKQLPSSMSVTASELETNYLRGLIFSPELTSREGFPMLMATQILDRRIFKRIRGEEGLSYSPQAFYALGIINNPYSVIQLDSETPLKALQIIMEMLKTIKEEGITEKELIHAKSSYLTQNYLREESTQGLGQSLYLAALRDEFLTTIEFNDRLNAVTVSQVNEVLKKFLTKIYWTYLGKNPEQFSPTIRESALNIGYD